MDKIISARIDESIANQIGVMAKNQGTSKKSIIESAIRLYAKKIGSKENMNVFDTTCGSWQRNESPEESIEKSRKAFSQSMSRHQAEQEI